MSKRTEINESRSRDTVNNNDNSNTGHGPPNQKLQWIVFGFFLVLGVYDFVTDAQLLDYVFQVNKVCKKNDAGSGDGTRLLRPPVPMALPSLTGQDLLAITPACKSLRRVVIRDQTSVLVTDYYVVECESDSIACYPINATSFNQQAPIVPNPLNATFTCFDLYENQGNEQAWCAANQTQMISVVNELYDYTARNREVVRKAVFEYMDEPQSVWDDGSCWQSRFDGSNPKFCEPNGKQGEESTEKLRLCEAASEVRIPSLLFLIISGPMFLWRSYKEGMFIYQRTHRTTAYFNTHLKYLFVGTLFEDFPQMLFFLALYNKGKCFSNLKNLPPAIFWPGFLTGLFSLALTIPSYVIIERRHIEYAWAILIAWGLLLIPIGGGILIGTQQEADEGGRAFSGTSNGLGIFLIVLAFIGFLIPGGVLFVRHYRRVKEQRDTEETAIALQSTAEA